jgi:hypothetical protein
MKVRWRFETMCTELERSSRNRLLSRMPSVGESTAELAVVDENSLSSKGTPQAQ